MADLEIPHDILVAGTSFQTCRQRVHRFFDRTTLIHYDEILVVEPESVSSADRRFRERMAAGIAANRNVLGELLANLQEEGFTTLEDLQSLEKGYLSKILHTVAHILDGFIGIDSRFYNLEEDSHTVSRDLLNKILADPGSHWILSVKGRIASGAADPFDALRTFEGRPK